MTINELNNKLTRALKVFIKKEGLVSSGALYNSIEFNSTYNNFDLKITLKSLEYIQYVDKGKLLPSFLALSTTKDIIKEFYVESIEEMF